MTDDTKGEAMSAHERLDQHYCGTRSVAPLTIPETVAIMEAHAAAAVARERERLRTIGELLQTAEHNAAWSRVVGGIRPSTHEVFAEELRAALGEHAPTEVGCGPTCVYCNGERAKVVSRRDAAEEEMGYAERAETAEAAFKRERERAERLRASIAQIRGLATHAQANPAVIALCDAALDAWEAGK